MLLRAVDDRALAHLRGVVLAVDARHVPLPSRAAHERRRPRPVLFFLAAFAFGVGIKLESKSPRSVVVDRHAPGDIDNFGQRISGQRAAMMHHHDRRYVRDFAMPFRPRTWPFAP